MKKKNNKKERIVLFYYLPLILWMGLIFYFSSLPGSGRQYPPDAYFYITRKGAHFLEYFVLALLFIRIFRFYKIKKPELYLAPISLSLAYAFSDEIHQLFVFGREGKFLDVGVDLLGMLLAAYLDGLMFNKIKKTKKKKRHI